MNKEYALQTLNEVQGTSPSYIREYGVSTVKEALRYIKLLKKQDPQWAYLIDNVSDKLSRI